MNCGREKGEREHGWATGKEELSVNGVLWKDFSAVAITLAGLQHGKQGAPVRVHVNKPAGESRPGRGSDVQGLTRLPLSPVAFTNPLFKLQKAGAGVFRVRHENETSLCRVYVTV